MADLRVAILGPLEATRNGTRVEPTSPKQRALLLDLLIHRGETVARERLIEDLWGDGPPGTAAGVLQNYVSQLRRALGADAVRTVVAGYAAGDGIRVDVDEFEAQVEQARVARQQGDAATVAAASAGALALWRGEPLADVAYEAFALAEVQRLTELRALATELRMEADIAGGSHDTAVASLEVAVGEHPLRERLWWLLMLALYRSGRQADALRSYQRARTMLNEELGIDPGEDLRRLEQAILEQHVTGEGLLGGRAPRPARSRRRAGAALVGRDQEWFVIETFLERAEEAAPLLLLQGEPGIGKTRLLQEIAIRVGADGGLAIMGRAYEAERSRPYGVWIDALREAPLDGVSSEVRAALAPLLPELGQAAQELDDPNRLYEAAVHALSGLAKTQPVVVLLDDMQWLDDASTALLHFALRHLTGVDVQFAATARTAELADNNACRRLVDGLRREDALVEVVVGPLAAPAIAALTESIAPGADAASIAEATNGNPLFAVEMARALARGDSPLSSRLDALISERLSRLDDRARSLVPWVAAFGRMISPALLAALGEQDPISVFAALGELERYGVLQADPNGDVDFVHDLVRAAAYEHESPARRMLLHARIAAVLELQPDPDNDLAAETVRHADAGGDSVICAAACARAARRCVGLLAYDEASDVVELGRAHARKLAPAARVHADLELLHVLLHPALRLRDRDLAGEIAELCADAQRLGLDTDLTTGLNLLSRAYHWAWGDIPRARALLERASKVIENSESPTMEPLLEGARCLAYLGFDMPRTARLFDELGALHALAHQSVQYQWGLGLVEAWRGNVEASRAALSRAIDLAVTATDHWIEFECTARLALLEFEADSVDAACRWAARLGPLAEQLGEGSERAFADAIAALCDLGQGAARLDTAINALERVDARILMPDILGLAAERLYRAGDLDAAAARAATASQIATEVDKPFELARAQALLACIAASRRAGDDARKHLAALSVTGDALPGHVEALRREAERLIADE